MGFSFTATAQCDLCGNYLSDSTEECQEHDGQLRYHMFRHLSNGDMVQVEATPGWKWNRLKEQVGEGWIAYIYIGERNYLSAWTDMPSHDLETAPVVEMAHESGIDV